MSQKDLHSKNEIIEIDIKSESNINVKEKEKNNLQEQKITEEKEENINLKNVNSFQKIPELDFSQNTIKIKKSGRNYGIDLLRLVSMCMIIILHILGQGGVIQGCKKYSFSYYIAWLMETFAYCSVNVFAQISGYVMVKSKIAQSKIIILWLNVFYYSTIITLLYKYIPFLSKLKPISRYDMVLAILLPISSRRYWYFSSYFGMYFFIPFMNKLIHSLEQKEMKNLCLTIIILFTIVNILAPKYCDPFRLNFGYSSIWLISLYFIGAYLKLYPIKLSNKMLLLFYLLSIIIPWVFKLKFISEFLPKFYYDDSLFIQFNSPFILINSIIIVIFFSNLKIKNKIFKKFIEITSPLSFSVYLIHTNLLVFQSYSKYFQFLTEKNTFLMILMVLAYSLGILFSCLIIDLIRFHLFQLFNIHEIPNKVKKLIIK